MQLTNRFTVPRNRDETWRALLDIEKMALCMPGASLTSVEAQVFTGTVTLKVGPVMMTYAGEGEIVEQDEVNHVLKLRLKGKERKGGGTAAALVSASLTQDALERTVVDVTTDLQLTGRPAQFGRGVLAEVAGTVVSKFADNLAQQLSPAKLESAVTGLARERRPVAPDEESLDLGSLGLALAKSHRKKLIAVALGALAILVAIGRRRAN